MRQPGISRVLCIGIFSRLRQLPSRPKLIHAALLEIHFGDDAFGLIEQLFAFR